jgi:hypothetical protein
MKAFNDVIEGKEAERKAYKEKMMAEWEADRIERNADFKKRMAKRKTDREVAARLEAIHDKTDANQMKLEHETEHQENMDASLKDIKEDIKTNAAVRAETKAIQAKTDAD